MKTLTVQKHKVSNEQIDRKLDEVTSLLKEVISKIESVRAQECEYCGKPINEHKFKSSYLRKLKKAVEDHRSGRVKLTKYRSFADFTRTLS